jgi:hypothetical protein
MRHAGCKPGRFPTNNRKDIPMTTYQNGTPDPKYSAMTVEPITVAGVAGEDRYVGFWIPVHDRSVWLDRGAVGALIAQLAVAFPERRSGADRRVSGRVGG